MKVKFTPVIICIPALLLLALIFGSCRKAIKGSGNSPAPAQVDIQFNAIAADSSAKLNVQIYDTNSGHIYYSGTTPKNMYSGDAKIAEGSSVTFVASATIVTNISSQITSNSQAVAIGNYNAAQFQGQAPSVTLYYKWP